MKKILYILIFALALAACKKQPFLDVDKPALTVASAGGTEQVNVSANYPWTASASESWIKVKYTEGESVLTVTVSSNNDTDGRQGTITIKSEELTKTISVTQNQRDAIELDEAGRLVISSAAQQIDIKLRSNVDLTATVTEGSGWISVLSVKAMVPHTVTLAVQANTVRTMRRALVTFSDKSGKVSQQIMIDQEGKPQVLRVDFKDIRVFQVPLIEAPPGSALTGFVFWDAETEGIPYAKNLFREYNLAAGSLRIEAHNAATISFSDVDGLTAIDLSEF